MAARNTARKRAFQILFEADQRGTDVVTVLADWIRHSRTDTRQPPVSEFTMELVEGYAQKAGRIDELISQYAVGWTLDRMPVVDRNILRLGAYELIWVDGTPDAVVLDEAVQLAKEFSTDDSPAFVNGLLGRFKDLKPTLRRDEARRPSSRRRARQTRVCGPSSVTPQRPHEPPVRREAAVARAETAGVAGTESVPATPAARFC